MIAKAHILALIRGFPDDVSLREIARQVSLVAGIREAQEQIARGESFSAEDILKEMPSWVSQPPPAITLA
jgi:hypothetical protein